MLGWIRQDEALRGWPLWLLLVGANGWVVAGLLMTLSYGRGGVPSPAALAASLWVGIAAYLGFGRVRTRCLPMQLALPLPARRLWLHHVLAVTLVGGLLAAVALALMALQERFLPVPGGLGLDVPVMLAHLLAAVALAVVLLQLPRPGLARVPASRGYVLWALAVLGGMPWLLLLLLPLGIAGALPTLALAVGVALVARRRLPAAYAVAPLEPLPSRAHAAAGTARPARTAVSSRRVVVEALWRGTSAGGLDWLGYPLVLIFGAIAGGCLGLLDEDLGALRYLYIPVTAFLLFSTVAPRLGRLHHLDPLPVARRVLFALLVVPHLAVFLVGYGLGAVGAGVGARTAERVDYRETRGGWSVLVPLSVRSIAWDGHVPAQAAPWGEAHVPVAWPLWRGSRAALYSPFSAPAGSSRDFVAWQLSRAIEAVYGAPVPASLIAERDLEVGADGSVAARSGLLSLRRHHPGLAPRHEGPMLPAMLALTCVPWLLLVAVLLRAYRSGAAEWTRQGVFWGATGLVMAVFLALSGATMAGLLRFWLFRALVEIPVRALGGSLAGTLAAWAAAAALLVAAYALAQRQFLRMEVPVRPTRFTLVDFVRDEG